MILQSSFERKKYNNKNNTLVVAASGDRDNLRSIALFLDTLKLEYYLANNGKTALDLVYEKKPNLVLLDLEMPYLTGIEVNILIKSDLFTSHISTIAITGNAEPKQIEAIEDAGFDDYMVEPLLAEDLETRTKRFVNNLSRASF